MAERLPEFDPDARLAQIRRRQITIAHLDGPRYTGEWVPAKNFLRAADDRGSKVRDESECVELIESLLAFGLLDEWQSKQLQSRASFAERRFRLTKKGHALWSEEIDPIPGIADARFE